MGLQAKIADFFKPPAPANRKVAEGANASRVMSVAALPSDDGSADSSPGSSQRTTESVSLHPPASRETPFDAITLSVGDADRHSRSPTLSLSPLPSDLDIMETAGPTRARRELRPPPHASSVRRSPRHPKTRAVPSPPEVRTWPTRKMPFDSKSSFNSASSHSGPPISSQSSSRRIVRGGQVEVTDSHSDDSMDEEGEALDEMEELIRQKMLENAAKSSRIPAVPSTARPEARNSSRSLRVRPPKTARKTQAPPAKEYRFNLESMAKHSKAEAAWGEKRRRHDEQELEEEAEEKRQKLQIQESLRVGLDQVIDDVRGKDAGPAASNELVRALERMDATQEETHYHFFKRTDVKSLADDFPVEALQGKAWKNMMKQKASREQALQCGFVADMARIRALPDDIMQWIFRALLCEKNTSLSLAYVHAIGAQFHTTPGSLETVRNGLLDMAGRGEAILSRNVKSPAPEDALRQSAKLTQLAAVRWCSVLTAKVATRLPSNEQRDWLHLLMLILIDRDVQQEVVVKTEVQRALAALMDAVPTDHTDATIRHITSLPNAILVYRLLSNLPSLNGTMHAFKRRLALSYFMKSSDYLSSSLDIQSIASSITRKLDTSSKFKITECTDYEAMGARIGILDIAIGAGFSDFSFLPDESAEKADTPVFGVGLGRRRPACEQETVFNVSIDTLVAKLQSIVSSIRDAGAAHLQRTECKGMIEQLAYRLEFAARTRAKSKSMLGFGDGVRQTTLPKQEPRQIAAAKVVGSSLND